MENFFIARNIARIQISDKPELVNMTFIIARSSADACLCDHLLVTELGAPVYQNMLQNVCICLWEKSFPHV